MHLCLRLLCLVAAVAAPLPGEEPSPILGSPRCQVLCQEGQAFKAGLKFNEALAKYQEAAAADPKASMPLSLMAEVFFQASGMTEAANVEPYRARAAQLAQAALALQGTDPLALEVLRGLSGEVREHTGTKVPAASKAYEEAETFFAKGDYVRALPNYEEAARLDPAFAKATLYAGDCHFALKDFAKAETCYTRATELDPLDAQAWRFLADARASLGRPRGAVREALVQAISAQPNYLPAWDSLASLGKGEGVLLKAFRPALGASLTRDPKGGKVTLNLEERFSKGGEAPDGPAWLAFGAGQAAAIAEAEKQGTEPPSPFSQMLAGWKAALVVLSVPGAKSPADATLLQFRAFAAAGHLETAIFLFQYREAYRRDFEAYKRKNPKAIGSFLEVFPLRPPSR